MYYPLFDIHSLSNDELLTKINKLHQRLDHAEMYNQPQMAHEIRLMLESLRAEHENRIMIRMEEKEQTEISRHPELEERFGTAPINLGTVDGEEPDKLK